MIEANGLDELAVTLERLLAQVEMLHALLDEKLSELIMQVGRVAAALDGEELIMADPYDRNTLNAPYEDPGAAASARQVAEWARLAREQPVGNPDFNPYTARLIPGGDPGVVTMPGTDQYFNPTGGRLTLDQVDPQTQAFGRLVQQHPEGSPSVADTNAGGRFQERGYRYRGQPLSPDEMGQLQSGNLDAARQLAIRSAPGWQARPLSGMQQFAHDYYTPAIMAAPAIASAIFAPGISAPLLAGTFGAMSAGAQTGYKNPGAIALGGAAGAAGGYGGSALGGALGAGPVATGALTGAGSAAGREAGTEVGTGQFDPATIARQAAIGGATGAATSGVGQLGLPSAVAPVASRVAGQAAGQAAGAVLPQPAPRRSLYAQPQFAPRDQLNDSFARWVFRGGR